MTMITKGDILGLFSHVDPNNLESELWYHVDRDKLIELLDKLSSFEPPASVQRKSFVPTAQYAAGGAAMADAIERFTERLTSIQLDLDAHRAALVAAGWLDANGNVVARDDNA